MNQLLTVIVQTSPIPSHPSTALLQALFRSFHHVKGLRECRILLVCDGCNEISSDQEEGLKRGKVSSDSAIRYRQHLERLEREIRNAPFGGLVELLVLKERHGSARAIELAVSTHLETPFVMICQHDNLFVADVPLRSILTAMNENPWLKAVHFCATATLNYIQKVKKRYGLDVQPRMVEELTFPLVPLVFWFGRTHVARSEYYRDFVLNRELKTGDHLEELLGETQLCDVCKNGMKAHALYGNFVLDQGKEVLYHLSGRRVRAVNEERPCNDEATLQQNTEGNDEKGSEKMEDTDQTDASNDGTSSFSTARSCRAIVPGLEFLPETSGPPPTGRFRQKCFHCGVKGHSFKFCPDSTRNLPEVETIDLS